MRKRYLIGVLIVTPSDKYGFDVETKDVCSAVFSERATRFTLYRQ